jgi:HPt (histidine-containing phosphotransfer) domain-containing protein
MTLAAQNSGLPDEPECDIDLSQLQDLAQVLPPAALKELMASFDASFTSAHEKLIAATAARDLDAAGCEAHDLKSITGNFGMRRLQHIAESIESACRNDNAADVIRLVPEIAVAWAAARTKLDAFKVEAAS